MSINPINILLFRYLAICYPFLVQQDAVEVSFRGKRTRSRRTIRYFPPSKKRFWKYTLLVFTAAIVSNISVFLEFITYLDIDKNERRIKVSALRLNVNYVIFFKNGFEGVILVILPFIVMVCLNARIIYTLWQRKKCRNIIPDVNSHRRDINEMNLASTLVAMDIVFLMCNLGRVIVNIWELYQIERLTDCMSSDLPYKVNWR